jgi:hypothetical protein
LFFPVLRFGGGGVLAGGESVPQAAFSLSEMGNGEGEAMKITARVILRDNRGGDTKIAICKLTPRRSTQASTTSNDIFAVQRAAMKMKGIRFTKSGSPAVDFEESGIQLTRLSVCTWAAEWEEGAK